MNGFIPMADFVLHGDDELHSSDCDLIAVRFPHVYEAVGGRDNDWDHDLLDMLCHDGRRTLAVFVQVKAGSDDGNRFGEIRDYFSRHLRYLVKRLGFWPLPMTEHVARDFDPQAVLATDRVALSKAAVLRDIPNRRQQPKWLEIPLEQVIHFIMARMKKYAPDRYADRMFFPDSVIQFLADQAHTPRHRWLPEPPSSSVSLPE